MNRGTISAAQSWHDNGVEGRYLENVLYSLYHDVHINTYCTY